MFGASKLEKRVKELEESLERIERACKKLEIEWAETYDKFRQLNWRVAKRVKALESLTPDEEPADAAPPQKPAFSSRAEEINAQILARRNRMAVQPRNGG